MKRKEILPGAMFSKQRGMKLIKIISTYLAHACSCVCVFFFKNLLSKISGG